jgi:hypothetical protein
LINVGGLDFVDGKKKLVLGVIWQLFRKDVMKVNIIISYPIDIGRLDR